MTDQASKTDQANRSAVARRTRRQLLAGGTGALAAVLTAEALTRPTPAAAAANGDTVILGQGNSETLPTVFVNSAGGVAALAGTATGSGTGVGGNSDSGDGVLGTSVGGTGVHGTSSGSGSGVHGTIDGPSGIGVFGENPSGTAVGGISGASDGVGGTSGSGNGVHGVSSTGAGVSGECAAGTGVLAAGKTALKVKGSAVFSRSGILTVAAGSSSATKTGVALSSASLVLATLQQDRAGVWVRSAVPNVAASSFTIHLSKAVSARAKVAWFVVN
jgi:hypothetical protein